MIRLKEDIKYGVGDDNIPYIEVVGGVYEGVVFTLGAIRFPDENEPILQFEYNILSGLVDEKKSFETSLGDLIVEMLEERLTKGEVLYTGGVDDVT